MTITRYLTEMLIAVLIFSPFYAFIRWFVLRRHKKAPDIKRELCLALFVLYLIALSMQTFRPGYAFQFQSIFPDAIARLQTGEGINLIPFKTVYQLSTAAVPISVFLINIVGNIILFMPIGFFTALLWKHSQHWWAAILCGLGYSVIVEFTQLFINRSVDVDDLILNTLAALLGYLFYRILRYFVPSISLLAK